MAVIDVITCHKKLWNLKVKLGCVYVCQGVSRGVLRCPKVCKQRCPDVFRGVLMCLVVYICVCMHACQDVSSGVLRSPKVCKRRCPEVPRYMYV